MKIFINRVSKAPENYNHRSAVFKVHYLRSVYEDMKPKKINFLLIAGQGLKVIVPIAI